MTDTSAKKRTPPEEMDQLRVRVIRGSKLSDLSDGQREWVWRSLLKGVRRAETMALGGFSDAQYERGVERARRLYAMRLADYKRRKADVLAVQVVRPVKSTMPPKRKGFWFFGRGGGR